MFALLQHSGSSFRKIFIVVDGLNALREEVSLEFLAKLRELQSCLPVNLMMTSRPVLSIPAELTKGNRSLLSITITNQHEQHIREYVEKRIDKLASRVKLSPQAREAIIDKIVSAAGGRILLAPPQLDFLVNKATQQDLREGDILALLDAISRIYQNMALGQGFRSKPRDEYQSPI